MDYIQIEIQKIDKKISENQKLLKQENDKELVKLFEEEIAKLEEQKNALEMSIGTKKSFDTATEENASDSNINPNVATLEIRAGTGGDEAGLFAADLLRMYTRYGEKNNWKFSEIFRSENNAGGIKTVSIEIKGKNVCNLLKNESGVHRVQRVPVTESGGRIHTSTATVAVLPKLKKINIEVHPDELKWEFFRAGGKGGQNVNKVSTAVRLTYLPKNIVIECQEERQQGKNREKALGILDSKLYTLMQEQQVKSIKDLRSTQVGSGERHEKIKTYNFPQSRLTDHRIGKSWHNIETIMEGNIKDILSSQELPQE